MSFIAKSPLSAAKLDTTPPSLSEGNRGIFPTEDGWFDIDDTGKVNRILTIDSSGLVPSKHLYNAIPHTTVSGYPISVSDHLNEENVIDYKIYGNSTQETRNSKNLFSGFVKGVGLNQLTGVEYTDSTCAASDYIAVDFNKNPNYTFSGTLGVLDISIFAYNSNKEYLGRGDGVGTVHLNTSEFKYNTTGAGGDIVYLRVSAMEDSELGGTIDDIDTWRVQLEIGKFYEEEISYEPYGDMPSPEFPSEVESVGDLVTDETSEYYGKYDVPITICGKNLLSYPYYETTITKNGITFTDNGDGTITTNGTSDSSVVTDFKLCQNLSIDAGKYTVSGCPSSGGASTYMIYVTVKDKVGNTIYHYEYTDIGSGFTFIAGENCAVYISIRFKKSIGTVSNLIFKPQLEMSSSATEYEPYTSETKHIYLDEPLRKIGDYADYIDFKNQKVIRQTTFRTFDGTENFGSYPAKGFYYTNSDMKKQTLGYGYCNYYLRITSSKDVGIRFGAGNNNVLYFCNVYTDAEPLTVAGWKEKLSNWNTIGNPLIVYYILDTPTEESITVPDLTIPNSEVTNVLAGTTIQPSSMDVTYYQDINKVITELKNTILAQGGNV